MQVVLGAKCLHDSHGANQCALIELGNRTVFRHDIPITKISSKVGETVEDSLEETVTIPVEQRHPAPIFDPKYLIRIIDNGNEVEGSDKGLDEAHLWNRSQ